MPWVLIIARVVQRRGSSGQWGSVAGTVNNATPGGMLPVGAPVVLQFFSEGAWTGTR